MVRLLPIASGKGGVGKSVLAANLGLALARAGRTVVLVDLDLGGSNLHTCLGVKNKHPGLGALVWKQERSISDLLVETGYDRLWLVPGDGLMPGTANLEWFAKKRILKELSSLPADFALLDLGAGSSYNVVDFFLAARDGILVVKPEVTSILNAYSFLKTAAFRLLQRSFPESSPGRAAVAAFAAAKTEGAGVSFLGFARELAERFPPEGEQALERLGSLRPLALMNQGRGGGDAELGYRLRDIALKNLGLSIEFAGYLLEDEAVPRSVAARRPLVDLEPSSPFARGVAAVARRIAAAAPGGPAGLLEEGSDIAALVDEAWARAAEEEARSQAGLGLAEER
ncbi:MAG TPA: P-loop NTPase [Spirochaetales bacterium]|nr:P-loop NTPase [Spirochaetales bacterium]HRY54205.1 P-loop NTPase [Spirochaetia bacterium]HRZ64821.1 P-loop NTPase [Spirochaetia bacterium]